MPLCSHNIKFTFESSYFLIFTCKTHEEIHFRTFSEISEKFPSFFSEFREKISEKFAKKIRELFSFLFLSQKFPGITKKFLRKCEKERKNNEISRKVHEFFWKFLRIFIEISWLRKERNFVKISENFPRNVRISWKILGIPRTFLFLSRKFRRISANWVQETSYMPMICRCICTLERSKQKKIRSSGPT